MFKPITFSFLKNWKIEVLLFLFGRNSTDIHLQPVLDAFHPHLLDCATSESNSAGEVKHGINI